MQNLHIHVYGQSIIVGAPYPFMTEPTNMPPAPSSLVWPTILIPRKFTVSVGREERGEKGGGRAIRSLATKFTHNKEDFHIKHTSPLVSHLVAAKLPFTCQPNNLFYHHPRLLKALNKGGSNIPHIKQTQTLSHIIMLNSAEKKIWLPITIHYAVRSGLYMYKVWLDGILPGIVWLLPLL